MTVGQDDNLRCFRLSTVQEGMSYGYFGAYEEDESKFTYW